MRAGIRRLVAGGARSRIGSDVPATKLKVLPILMPQDGEEAGVCRVM